MSRGTRSKKTAGRQPEDADAPAGKRQKPDAAGAATQGQQPASGEGQATGDVMDVENGELESHGEGAVAPLLPPGSPTRDK